MKCMHKYLLLILLFSFSLVSFAQVAYKDVIYLKNGSIVKGIIIEFVPAKSYTIKTADGSIFVYQVTEILKIAKEEIKTEENNNASSGSDTFSKGYRGIIEGGGGAKTGKYGLNSTNFAFSNGYQFNPNLYAGVALGLNYFPSEITGTDGFGLIPLYADARYSFLPKNPISPYAGMGAGFSFDPNNSFEGAGFYFNPSVGAQYSINKRYKINLSFNYRLQQMPFLVVNSSGGISKVIRFSESAGIAVGFVF